MSAPTVPSLTHVQMTLVNWGEVEQRIVAWTSILHDLRVVIASTPWWRWRHRHLYEAEAAEWLQSLDAAKAQYARAHREGFLEPRQVMGADVFGGEDAKQPWEIG